MRHSIDKAKRQLLKQLACLPLTAGVSMLAGNGRAEAMCANARSLVCVFLAGGADSFNMFVPGGSAYTDYRNSRNELAVPEADLVAVSDAQQGSFAFHRLLPSFEQLYREQRMAVISNTGTLIQPTTKSDYLGTVALPQALFAHNTQQKLWQTGAGVVNGNTAFGWGGAISDHASNCNGNIAIAPSFSMGGSSDWLASANTNYISLNADVAVQRMFGYDNISDWIPPQRLSQVGRHLNQLIAQAQDTGNPLLSRAIASSVGRASAATASLYTALQDNPLPQMQYNGRNKLAKQLHLVARLIASREQLGMQKQVFFVLMGGWDTHSDQLERLPQLMTQLNEAIGTFQQTIDGLNLAASVTSFTASDFGRTLSSNGNGTDHGWGGHNFVFGGAVDGGRVYGETPNYSSTNNPDDAGEDDGSFAGRIIPQISVNQYAATLARWMGVAESDLNQALPDLQNFTETDLGFMQS
ncbi:MAG: DUF1501 domain-containing protein [Granulosicoccus sp.]|nr:DUF1501 domain-containing protein [Granulosicoccus sp.]